MNFIILIADFILRILSIFLDCLMQNSFSLENRNPMKNTISWNALIISGYCKYGSEEVSGFAFRTPDEYTLGSVLKMCTSLGLILRGEQIHGFTGQTGFDLDVGVVNGLLAMYAQWRRISAAEYLFGTMAL